MDCDMCLADKQTKESLPLKNVSFDVEIEQGFADFKITQVYENTKPNALEILFKMPYSETFSLSKITATIFLKNGTKKFLETKITERAQAYQKFEDAVASG